jgi:hypothetical protein
MHLSDPIPETLVNARPRLERTLAVITDACAERLPAEKGKTGPAQLAEGAVQFMALALRVDRLEGETSTLVKEDVTQLGDHGLNLLMELIAWTRKLDLDDARRDLESVTLSATEWILRHQGEIRTLEPIVDALAATANRLKEPRTLEALAQFMGRIAGAVASYLRQDLELTNPGRPWRMLLLNRGIVATRSHNTRLMEQAFEDLTRELPMEAPRFFAEGMEQMQALDYPRPVREIMARYFEKWARPRMH